MLSCILYLSVGARWVSCDSLPRKDSDMLWVETRVEYRPFRVARVTIT